DGATSSSGDGLAVAAGFTGTTWVESGLAGGIGEAVGAGGRTNVACGGSADGEGGGAGAGAGGRLGAGSVGVISGAAGCAAGSGRRNSGIGGGSESLRAWASGGKSARSCKAPPAQPRANRPGASRTRPGASFLPTSMRHPFPVPVVGR